MRRAFFRVLPLALLAAAACGTESPVEVGEQLLPDEPVTSFEVVLDADRFLVLDSAFALFRLPYQAQFVIVAEDFEGVLDAHALARFQTLPRSITVRDTVGTGTVSDTLPSYIGGRLVVLVDTTRSSHDEAAFAVYRAAEEWDYRSTTWELRVDSGAVEEPWAQPGGTLGERVGEALWTRADGDTLRLEMDSLAVRALRDSLDARRGFILVAETPGVRMRINSIALEADARSSRADTVVAVTGVLTGRTFVYTPSPGTRSDDPRIGGIPAWRTLIRLAPELREETVPCPGEPGCTIRLGDAEITVASLEYQLADPPPGFVLEDSLRIGAVPMFETPGVPFSRSLLGSVVSAVASDRWVQPSEFDDVASADPVRIPITAAIRSLMSEDATQIGIALIPAVDLGTFGFIPLQPEPRLRLVLTISEEVQLQ